MTGWRLVLAGLVLLVAGCEGPDLGLPWDFERMLQQPRGDAYAPSNFFADGKVMQSPPAGSVPFGAVDVGRPPLTRGLLEDGRRAFEITCAACHGVDGEARTPVAAAMTLRRPPSLHEKRLRDLSLDALHQIVDQGYGLMPSYASLLDLRERWAVAAYVQTLQRSRRVALDRLPPDLATEARRALLGAEREP
ncbi:MAG TPA: cytochrome c [Myxococcota bacterium]|nr:cytochrome c [Myxococcota bacterium]